MYQFFVEDAQVLDTKVIITGSDVNHIGNVLRMRSGEKVRISTQSGRSYFCHIDSIAQDEVIAQIDAADEHGTELSQDIWLFQGLPKSDKMELIIQKAVELGANHIVPVAMKNCVAKLDDKKAKNKVERWQEIAKSAAKQSKRSIIPDVCAPMSWKEALKAANEKDICLVPYENERGMAATREAIRSIKEHASVAIMIGPEGGFADAEIADVDAIHEVDCTKGIRISLGNRILRTETAGLATLSMMIYELEERD